MAIACARLNHSNFTVHSLDTFVRHLVVTRCWREMEENWRLVPISLVEDWSPETCREIAADVAAHLEKDQTAIGAFDGDTLVGFITLSHTLFGTGAKYAELVCFQVSESYRGRGIRKALFHRICGKAGRIGGEKLYISAHSAMETQAAYRALGCVPTGEINWDIAREEPFDVQLEYTLTRMETPATT